MPGANSQPTRQLLVWYDSATASGVLLLLGIGQCETHWYVPTSPASPKSRSASGEKQRSHVYRVGSRTGPVRSKSVRPTVVTNRVAEQYRRYDDSSVHLAGNSQWLVL